MVKARIDSFSQFLEMEAQRDGNNGYVPTATSSR